MSSGTQVEMDWTGVNAAQNDAVTTPPTGVNGAGAGAHLTDEEILGIEPVGGATTARREVISREARNPSGNSAGAGEKQQRDSSGRGSPLSDNAAGVAIPQNGSTEGSPTGNAMPEWMRAAAGDPKHGAEAQKLWQEHQAFRASFSSPDEARAIKGLFPGGAQEAQTLRQAAQAVDQLDAAIYSGDSRAQSEVVAELARANPAAFRQLFAEAAKVLAGMGQVPPMSNQTPTLRESGEGWGTQHANSTPTGNTPGSKDPGYNNTARTQSVGQESQITSHESQVTGHQSPVTNHAFDPTAYAAFERSTNDTVARDVRVAVGDTLARVLPDGIAEGAARRIGEDIFNEIHRTLASDRSLSEQVGEILRGSSREFSANGWRFGTAEQQRVASLLASRAKQLVPGVARRVIGEWTSSVLGASRSKAARQASAAARVDIAAPGGSLDSMALRAMSPREVDYASMSDDEILGM
jgi:hypothetical protein